jgi:hypothetical protein
MKSSENNEENTEISVTQTINLTDDESSSEKEWKPKDPNNLTKEEKKVLFLKQKDIFKLFYIVFGFSVVMVTAKFLSFFMFEVSISFNIEFLAKALNVCIVIIGLAEGMRSIGSTITSPAGENVGVPAYKLKYLFGYLISFIVITILATLFEFICKFSIQEDIIVAKEVPEFAANTFLSALASNAVSYLIARFGSKVTESIDLSCLPIFKFKK